MLHRLGRSPGRRLGGNRQIHRRRGEERRIIGQQVGQAGLKGAGPGDEAVVGKAEFLAVVLLAEGRQRDLVLLGPLKDEARQDISVGDVQRRQGFRQQRQDVPCRRIDEIPGVVEPAVLLLKLLKQLLLPGGAV